MSKKRDTVLVCPLSWGLGHATRCVPLIEALQNNGYRVLLGASGGARDFLARRFPALTLIEFPDYYLTFPASGRLVGALLLKLPFYLRRVHAEHQQLERLIETHGVDVVVSDNRYGLWSRKAHCIFIAHQLMVKAPPVLRFAEVWGHRILQKFIQRFDECWIPDVAGPDSLSGDLSQRYPLPAHARFVGMMSRFQSTATTSRVMAYDFLGLISGPEPQRSLYEEALRHLFRASGRTACIVRGQPGLSESEQDGNILLLPHAEDEILAALVRDARCIVCRPGYSTLMDLRLLGKSAVLVPTPGQTEQLYLAERLRQHAGWQVIQQDDLRRTDPETWLTLSPPAMPEARRFVIPPTSPLADSPCKEP